MQINELIQLAMGRGASDIHLSAGSLPTLRINGAIDSFGDVPLKQDDLRTLLEQMTTDRERLLFESEHELDFALNVPGKVRLRCNAAMQRGTVSLSIRLVPLVIPAIGDLNLPDICTTLALKTRGLIIISGMTGSGKSTTMAAIIQYLNTIKRYRIVTIEDPVEYVFTNGTCTIIQRELGSDTSSFPLALKHALRQDPDIIMVGEMRDRETAAAVLSLAETGHLVLTTGHAPSSYQTIERVTDLFPVQERPFAQSRLSSLLIAVLCQTLIPKANGSGRVPAVEVMLVNTAVGNLIREGKIHQIPNALRTHRGDGMETLDHSLMELYRRGWISGTSLLAACNDRSEIEKTIGQINVNRDEGHKEAPAWAAPCVKAREITVIE